MTNTEHKVTFVMYAVNFLSGELLPLVCLVFMF